MAPWLARRVRLACTSGPGDFQSRLVRPASPTPRAQPSGLRKSFGFGDRLGLGTPGHLLAARRFGFVPFFAQASIRDLERMRRPAADVVASTHATLSNLGFRGAWGADLSGVKTEADVDRALAAGYTRFTIDPSAFVEPRADHLAGPTLDKAVAETVNAGALPADWFEPFNDGRFEVEPGRVLHFTREDIHRAAVKFAGAVQQAQRLARHLAQKAYADEWEVEVSLTSAGTPTTPLEHLFVALEFRRRGAKVVALAPRFAFPLEPGIDARLSPSVFEEELAWHAAIATTCGPYQISVHAGAGHDSILPVIGRLCGDHMHVRTSGLTYLEALRVVCQASPELFREVMRFARARFDEDHDLAGVSTSPADLEPLFKTAGEISLENAFLGTPAGRQMVLATTMSVLTTDTSYRGRTLREAIRAYVAEDARQFHQLLDEAYTRHLGLLNQG